MYVKNSVSKSNLDEKAIVRLRIPFKKVEEEEEYVDPETGLQQKMVITKEVELEIDDRALLIQARMDALPFSIYVINQAVPRQHRREIFNYIRKNFAEYLEGRDA